MPRCLPHYPCRAVSRSQGGTQIPISERRTSLLSDWRKARISSRMRALERLVPGHAERRRCNLKDRANSRIVRVGTGPLDYDRGPVATTPTSAWLRPGGYSRTVRPATIWDRQHGIASCQRLNHRPQSRRTACCHVSGLTAGGGQLSGHDSNMTIKFTSRRCSPAGQFKILSLPRPALPVIEGQARRLSVAVSRSS